MMVSLQEFVNTLDDDIQELVSGKKTRGVINTLIEQGIDIPDFIIDEFENTSNQSIDHDYVIDCMRPFYRNITNQ